MRTLFDKMTEDDRNKVYGYLKTLLWIYAGNCYPSLPVLYNMFQDIFGKELFDEEINSDEPEFKLDVDKLSDEYAAQQCPENGYEEKWRWESDLICAKDECKSVLNWLNKQIAVKSNSK